MQETEPIKVVECFRVIQNLFAKPKYTEVNITMEAWIKLMSYIHLVGNYEVTGLGKIKNNTITDFKIPTQIVTETTADATDEAMTELLREIDIDEIELWELDWHSHVDMQAFISTTDEKNYELMSMARGNKQFPLLVVNKSGEVCFKNFIHKGKITDIELILLEEKLSNEKMKEIYDSCKEDVAKKVKKEKPVFVNKASKKGALYDLLKKSNAATKTQEVEHFCKMCGDPIETQHEIANGYCDDCMRWNYGYG